MFKGPKALLPKEREETENCLLLNYEIKPFKNTWQVLQFNLSNGLAKYF